MAWVAAGVANDVQMTHGTWAVRLHFSTCTVSYSEKAGPHRPGVLCWARLHPLALRKITLHPCAPLSSPAPCAALPQMVRVPDLDSRITMLEDGSVDFVIGCEFVEEGGLMG